MSRRPLSKQERISKTLSYLLRHGAEKEGLKMTNDGYINLEDILKYKAFKDSLSKNDIIEAVNNCPKQRFALKYETINENQNQAASNKEIIMIRANQGHSLDVEVELQDITDPDSLKQCLHGTYFRCWDSIRKNGLSKMNRQHIHLSEDFPDGQHVISGMRLSCQIAVYINVKEAMKDGIKFYRSANNVILSPGDENGFIKPKYFLKALNIKTNENLDY